MEEGQGEEGYVQGEYVMSRRVEGETVQDSMLMMRRRGDAPGFEDTVQGEERGVKIYTDISPG